MTKAIDPQKAELEAVEQQLVEWKRRAKNYGQHGMKAPPHVERRIEMLKADARLLREQMTRRETQ